MLREQGSQDIEYHDHRRRKRDDVEQRRNNDNSGRKQHERVANAVATPTIMLEFERKHGDFAHHDPTRDENEQEQH